MDRKKNIKVAHILKDLDLGGIQTLLLDLLAEYRRRGQPCVFVCIGTGILRERFEHVYPEIRFIEKKLPYFDPRVAVRLRKLLLTENVEVVHAHHTSEGIASLMAVAGTSIKLVQSFHVAPNISNRQDNIVLRFLARRADLSISPSVSQRTSLQSAGYNTEQMSVVYNGIDSARLKAHPERNIRDELGITGNEFLLVSIGNFYNDTRDQLTICKALPEFFQRFPDACFAFYGGFTNRYIHRPERYEACMAFCRDAGIVHKVFFPGVDYDIGSILEAADVFVYSSLGDTFGMAVTEAMLKGIPVIMNDLPVLMEISGGEEYVSVFRTQDPVSLKDMLIGITEQAQNIQMKSVLAKQYALSRYQIAHHVNHLDDVYAKLFDPFII